MNPFVNLFITKLLEHLAWSIPYFVVIGIALWICAKHRDVHPELSRLMTWAFGLFAFHGVLGPVMRAWMAAQVEAGLTMSKEKLGILYGVGSGLAWILNFVGWAVLLLAIHRTFQELTRVDSGAIVDVREDRA